MRNNMIKTGVYEGADLEKLYTKMMFDISSCLPGVIQSLCTKILKKDIYLECTDGLDNRITLGDDAIVVYSYLLKSHKIYIDNTPMYNYRTNLDSMCHSSDPDAFIKLKLFYDHMKKIIEPYGESYGLQNQLRNYMVHLIEIQMMNNFDILYGRRYYMPIKSIKGTKVVVYGAGRVGKNLIQQVIEQGAEIVAWLDKNKAGTTLQGMDVEKPERVIDLEYDYCIIAVANEDKVEEIKNEMRGYVDEEKFIWEKPFVDTRMRDVFIL